MLEVGGKLSILLMKMVVITNMVVKFTLKATSKKNGLKKVVAKVMAVRRTVGTYVVILSLRIFLFILNLKVIASLSWIVSNVQFVNKNMDISSSWFICTLPVFRVLSKLPIAMSIEHTYRITQR